MTTVVKAADAAEFLSLTPRLVGFTPTESLVVVPMARGRSIGAMRVDLPSPADVDQAAATVVGMVCRLPDADAIAAVVYTDAACGGEGLPLQTLATALRGRADACGVDVVDALCVAADGWGSYLDPDCPADGRPLAELAGFAALDAAGLPAPVGDQSSGAELPAVSDAERSSVTDALAAIERVVPRLSAGADAANGRGRGAQPRGAGSRSDRGEAERGGADEPPRLDPRALDAVGDLDDLPRLFEDALDGGASVEGFAAALLLWCLARPALRDIALVGWARGMAAGDDALDAQLGWERGEEYPESLALTLWGEGPRPDPLRLGRALALARRLAALAPPELSAGPLSVCAWLAWALGRSTHADRYASAAHAADPDHGFAGIMLSFVAAGHLPDWAFRPPRDAFEPGDSFRRPVVPAR